MTSKDLHTFYHHGTKHLNIQHIIQNMQTLPIALSLPNDTYRTTYSREVKTTLLHA